ncbi:hypothetical protein ACTXT7_008669 [Hymenolepis weldensis]
MDTIVADQARLDIPHRTNDFAKPSRKQEHLTNKKINGWVEQMRVRQLEMNKKGNSEGPLLTCLTVCFRELGLPSILLGLIGPLQPPEEFQCTDESALIESSLPEAMNSVYDISGVKHFGREKSPDKPLNWTTVSYLLNELKLKVDHLCGIDLKSSAGWYSFERFDAMSPQLRQTYLLAIVPCLAKIFNKLTCHFKDYNYALAKKTA